MRHERGVVHVVCESRQSHLCPQGSPEEISPLTMHLALAVFHQGCFLAHELLWFVQDPRMAAPVLPHSHSLTPHGISMPDQLS